MFITLAILQHIITSYATAEENKRVDLEVEDFTLSLTTETANLQAKVRWPGETFNPKGTRVGGNYGRWNYRVSSEQAPKGYIRANISFTCRIDDAIKRP